MGVSVVVCTHNGAARLPRALAALRAQRVPPQLAWEVVVVDNASSDASPEVALRAWGDGPVALRVCREERLGLVHANRRGFAEAAHEFVSLVNDDNAVAEDWVAEVAALMAARPEVGACGGFGEIETAGPLPEWFERYRVHFAVGPQAPAPGALAAPMVLWGAGLTVRQAAWLALERGGFEPLAIGRQGRALGAGEDYELGHALRLAGWTLWYAPELRFRHVIPAERLRWDYLRRLHRGFGAASVAHDPYLRAVSPGSAAGFAPAWGVELAKASGALLRHAHHVALGRFLEGDPAVLKGDLLVGRLAQLLNWRGRYDRALAAVRDARWRQLDLNSSRSA